MAREKNFRVMNGFGKKTGRPFVQITLGGEFVQVTPTKARQLASMLLECAESADSDGFLIGWLGMHMDSTIDQRGMILRDFRKYRETQRARDSKDLEPAEPFETEAE